MIQNNNRTKAYITISQVTDEGKGTVASGLFAYSTSDESAVAVNIYDKLKNMKNKLTTDSDTFNMCIDKEYKFYGVDIDEASTIVYDYLF